MGKSNESVGVRIKKLLERGKAPEYRKVSQTELALALHMSKDMLSKIITGKSKLSIDTAERIADYFDTSLDYLYGRTLFMNISLYLQEKICTQILPRLVEVNGELVPSLRMNKTFANYFETIFEISHISESVLPSDMRTDLIKRKRRELIDGLQNEAVDEWVDYHIKLDTEKED